MLIMQIKLLYLSCIYNHYIVNRAAHKIGELIFEYLTTIVQLNKELAGVTEELVKLWLGLYLCLSFIFLININKLKTKLHVKTETHVKYFPVYIKSIPSTTSLPCSYTPNDLASQPWQLVLEQWSDIRRDG